MRKYKSLAFVDSDVLTIQHSIKTADTLRLSGQSTAANAAQYLWKYKILVRFPPELEGFFRKMQLHCLCS